MAGARVLVVSGSARPDGQSRSTVEFLLETLREQTDAQVRCHDLSDLRLPLMQQDAPEQAEQAEVASVRADAAWAEGFLLVTPEYHGNMSGALKNWFDFLYLELAGKFAAVVAVTGGGSGDMSLTAVRNCFNWCHGFTLPYHAAARPADFDLELQLADRLRDRLTRIVHDVCRYAPVVSGAFEAARGTGADARAGVAGLHHHDREGS